MNRWLAKLFLVLAVVAAVFVLFFARRPADLAPGVQQYGITFSKIFAGQMKLDWRKTYTAILDELGARYLRIPAYWEEIEKSDGKFDFADLDWMLGEAGKRGAKVVLAVGRKLPRWPECHVPEWAQNLESSKQNLELLKYIEAVIKHFKTSPVVEYWQIENEPTLPFGICPKFDEGLLDKEVALARSLDSRQLILTDSGELGTWLPAANRADILGTTMYRTVWSKNWPLSGGYLHYPAVPGFFYVKANLVKLLAHTKDILVMELQAEPWGPKQIYESTPENWAKSMDLEKFRESVALAQAVGFRRVYLWGAEWWFSEKLAGRPEIWNEAKKLFGK